MTDYTGFTNSEYVEALEAERSELQEEVSTLKDNNRALGDQRANADSREAAVRKENEIYFIRIQDLQVEVSTLKKSAEADCTLIANQVCHIHDLETSLKEVQDNLTKAEKAEHGTCEECGDKGVVLHDTTWGNICQACEWGH